MSDQEVDTSGYVVLAMTANGWAMGSATTPYNTIVDRLRRDWGSAHIKKHGCVLYSVHRDFEVCGVTGRIETPIGHPAIKIEDRRPVVWTRDGDQHVGTLPGGKEARLTEWNGPLGRAFQVQVDGKGVGQVGGGENRDLLKRAKAMAEDRMKGKK